MEPIANIFQALNLTFILLVINLISLAMITAGFTRFRKPESGWLLISGFIGLAICSLCGWPFSYMLFAFSRDSNLNFDFYVKLYRWLSITCMIMPAILLFILFLIGLVHRTHRYSGKFMRIGGVGTVIAILILAVVLRTWIWANAPINGAQAVEKANTDAIQLALDRYAVDHDGLNPERIETLIDESYLVSLPSNSFTHQPMKNVPYGSPDFEGNFTYLPLMIDEKIHGYYLIAYGYKTTAGLHLLNPDQEDHVITVVSSSPDYPPWPPDELFPSVQEAIRSSQE
jgi:hypothetical protein